MTINDFAKEICRAVATRLGSHYTATVKTIDKNNGLELTGIVIRHDEKEIAPLIYIDSLYSRYTTDGYPFDSTVSDVISTYMAFADNSAGLPGLPDDISDYNAAKNSITLKLINTEKNRNMLEKIPHVNILDLSAIFVYVLSMDENNTTTMTITNQHMDIWGINTDTLYQNALTCTQKIMPYRMETIWDVMESITGIPQDTSKETMLPAMYVLTNKWKTHGAACMLYPMLLADFATACGSDFYIIPSSIHELLLIPGGKNTTGPANEIADIIASVNDAQVDSTEVLSYSLYKYSRKEGKIQILVKSSGGKGQAPAC